MTTTLIVSDVHLGTRNSHRAPLAQLLETDFDRLILNGDTVDDLNFRRFRPWDWAILHQLRLIARDHELVLIRGNHDGPRQDATPGFGPLDVLAELLDADLREEYFLRVGGRRYLVLHGDQFDGSLNLTRIGHAADCVYNQLQRCSRSFARWLKRRVKRWCGVVTGVRRGAVACARRRNCQGVITGHTHYHDDEYLDGIHYLNSGCWVDRPCTYLRADDDHIQLCYWGVEFHPGSPANLPRPAAGRPVALAGF